MSFQSLARDHWSSPNLALGLNWGYPNVLASALAVALASALALALAS